MSELRAPSRTGMAVAAARAQFDRPAAPTGDRTAQLALAGGMRPVERPQLVAHLMARTRFFDAQVLGALQRRVSQVVILGAGYDDRSMRFRTPGVRFFEVDHPATQQDKRQRLSRIDPTLEGITLVPADFRTDDVATRLAAAGHDASAPTLFLAEGLVVYFEPDGIVRLLSAVRSRAAEGSTLAISLAIHPDHASSEQFLARASSTRRNAQAEPWRTILPAAEHIALVARSGWTVTGSIDDAVLGTGAAPQRSLLCVARPSRTA